MDDTSPNNSHMNTPSVSFADSQNGHKAFDHQAMMTSMQKKHP